MGVVQTRITEKLGRRLIQVKLFNGLQKLREKNVVHFCRGIITDTTKNPNSTIFEFRRFLSLFKSGDRSPIEIKELESKDFSLDLMNAIINSINRTLLNKSKNWAKNTSNKALRNSRKQYLSIYQKYQSSKKKQARSFLREFFTNWYMMTFHKNTKRFIISEIYREFWREFIPELKRIGILK